MKSKIIAPDFRAIAANVRRAEAGFSNIEQPADGGFVHDRVTAVNANLLTESFFSKDLTTYAVGWKDPADTEAELDFLAPPVQVTRRFEYATDVNAEGFIADDDDSRAIKADFKDVTYQGDKVNEKTVNRGLQITVDLDEVADKEGWREKYTARLLRRLRRNQLLRAKVLLSAAAANTAKTWDTTSGKDPDQDVISELITAANLNGIGCNRVCYGDTAWSKRGLSHRAQNNAGGYASAGMTPEQLAGLLGVDGVMVSKTRYSSSSTARTGAVANLVLMFLGMEGADTEDPSSIKRFWSPCEGGTETRVYEQSISAKRYVIAVELYDAIKITSTLGIRQFTVS